MMLWVKKLMMCMCMRRVFCLGYLCSDVLKAFFFFSLRYTEGMEKKNWRSDFVQLTFQEM